PPRISTSVATEFRRSHGMVLGAWATAPVIWPPGRPQLRPATDGAGDLAVTDCRDYDRYYQRGESSSAAHPIRRRDLCCCRQTLREARGIRSRRTLPAFMSAGRAGFALHANRFGRPAP